jgi:hypothetical protein
MPKPRPKIQKPSGNPYRNPPPPPIKDNPNKKMKLPKR